MASSDKKTRLIGRLINGQLDGEYEDVDFRQLGMEHVKLTGMFRNCLFERAKSDRKKYPRLNNTWGKDSQYENCVGVRDEDPKPMS